MYLLEKLKEETEMKLKGGLYHQTRIKLAYNSNRIECRRLTAERLNGRFSRLLTYPRGISK